MGMDMGRGNDRDEGRREDGIELWIWSVVRVGVVRVVVGCTAMTPSLSPREWW